MLRQSNESVPGFLIQNGWPVDKEIILVTGGFGEVWFFAQLFTEIAKPDYRVFVVTDSVAKILSLFTDDKQFPNRLLILKEEGIIGQIEAFVVRNSSTYAKQYFYGKSFFSDIRCSSIVHHPYLCRAVQARVLEYHEALKVVFDLDVCAQPKEPDTTPVDPIAKEVLSGLVPDNKPICLLFCVNVTHESLDLSTIYSLVTYIEAELGMSVLLNVTLRANANGHGLDKARVLVQELSGSDLAEKCIEIDGHLLPSIGKSISLAIGGSGGGMDVIRLFGQADTIYIETPHRWEAKVESNTERTDLTPADSDGVQGRAILKRHRDFPTGPRGVLSYTPLYTEMGPSDVPRLFAQYLDFVRERDASR